MTQPKSISAMIVEDEPLGRAVIRELLKSHSEVRLVGECANGHEAIDMIQKNRPDLLFLDVRMPELDGFDVISSLPANHIPAIVFVTAYDEYAVRAFEVSAVDYLLKPFDRERFQRAIERVKTHLRPEAGDEPKYPERLMVRSSGRIIFVRTEEVDWIESEGNYVKLHVRKESHLMRTTISELEEHLDPSRFARIHRCHIVNIDRIRELRPWWHGEYQVLLKDGTQLVLSRTFRDRLRLGSHPSRFGPHSSH
jgi:two-component system LytT family response regulator